MKTILHICDWYHPIGGAEKLLFDTLALLEEEGFTNIIIYNDHPDQRPSGARPEYACKGLELFSYHYPGNRLLAQNAIKQIHPIIKKHAPDICHIHNFQNSSVTEYLIGTMPCVRSIHDPRLYCFTNWKLLPDKSICSHPLGLECIRQGCISSGLWPQNNFDRNALFVLRNFMAHQKIPVLIAESRAQIECLLENGFSPDQIAWLPNFTPVRPESEVSGFVQKHFNPQKKMVLFVGRASYEKGVQILVDACAYLKTKCKVVIITAGPLLDEIKSRIPAYAGQLEVIPGLSYEETRKYYARSSVVIVPSVWLENFCLVGIEAYANMKPVIGSRIGGIKDWLKEGETGWFFEPGNARELADTIDHAFADTERLKMMGKAAYDRVCRYYTKELYLSRLLAIYQRGIS
ncbi:MAG: glycosyltransferase family 4 protein, partial [Desulfobacterales bacterium]|nr:glycosyltransferase family 4 protein [Desulfobacterales bacterium]